MDGSPAPSSEIDALRLENGRLARATRRANGLAVFVLGALVVVTAMHLFAEWQLTIAQGRIQWLTDERELLYRKLIEVKTEQGMGCGEFEWAPPATTVQPL